MGRESDLVNKRNERRRKKKCRREKEKMKSERFRISKMIRG